MATLVSLKAEKRLLDRQAADSIRREILAGRMAPGWRLVETQLAEQLEVSRGTVRAALAQLAHEGLVRQVAFTKWEVSPISVVDAWELYTLRGALEGLAARLAAGRGSTAERRHLAATNEMLAQAVREGRFADATDADFALHRDIVAMAGHGRLASQHRILLQQVRVCMMHSGFLPNDFRDLIADHSALVSAVVEGDADRAEDLARHHNAAEIRFLAAAMAAAERQPAPAA